MTASKKLLQATGGGASGIEFVFVAQRAEDTVYSIDVSNTSNMVLLDSVSGSARYDNVRDVAMDPTRPYLFTGSDADLSVVDVSDPSNLSEIANKPGASRFGLVQTIKTYKDGSNNYAVLGTSRVGDQVWVNESNDSPLDLDDQDSVGAINGAWGIALDAANNYVYVSSVTDDYIKRIGWPSTYSLDSADVTQLNLTASDTPRGIAIDTASGYLYVACGIGSIKAIDLSNFTSGGISTLTDATRLDKPVDVVLDSANSILYAILENGDGVTSIDVSTPTSMSILGNITSANFENAVSGVLNEDSSVLFVTTNTLHKLIAVDVSDASSMSEISDLELGSSELNGIAYYKP